MTCKLCLRDPICTSFANMPNRKCAFTTDTFSSNNWNCATMIELRKDIGDEWCFSKKQGYVYGEDQSCYSKHVGDGIFLVIGWYKDRGQTEYAGLLDGTVMNPLTLQTAEAILAGQSPLRLLRE